MINFIRKNKNEDDLKVIRPPNLGWLEKRLSQTEMDYLWRCVNNRKGSLKNKLAGNISESNVLIDKSDWFFSNTLAPLCIKYSDEFENLGNNIPINQKHPYYLDSFWVNFQKQTEFNPIHNHSGIYSFVIWMKIPTRHSVQNKNPISFFSNSSLISGFQFNYIDLLGNFDSYLYEMNPEMEGTLIFFPSKMQHCVYPFFNCDEDRISISGNISLNTSKKV